LKLTEEEDKLLFKTYGRRMDEPGVYVLNGVEEVLELTADEEKFFDQKNFVSPYFSVQTLYKVNFEISPMAFNRTVRSMMTEDKNFRTNFCKLYSRTVKVIFSDHSGTNTISLPEIVYKNLSHLSGEELDDTLTKIMEADRRKVFDLQNDHLFRFSVLYTGGLEYAVLFTAVRLISESFDAQNFFSALASNKPYQKTEEASPAFYIEHVEKAVRDHWEKTLSDLPPIKKLPYSKITLSPYKEAVYRSKIPADIVSDLRGKAQSNKAMLMSILQSAWGFLLQATENVHDVAFCQLVSTTKKNGKVALNIIPVRLNSPKNVSVEKLVNDQFKQMVVSKPYSFFDWNGLQSETDSDQTFDHFLSFLDFDSNQKSYSQSKSSATGTVVAKNSWDSQGMKLGLYFQYSDSNLILNFMYDANSFVNMVGERFAKIYNLVLRQMLVYWNSNFKDFIENVVGKIVAELELVKIADKEDDKKIIRNFVSANQLFHGESVGNLQFFSDNSKLVHLFEGDRVDSDLLEKNLVFVVSGKLARSLDSGDGWFNALDIISTNGWLNETILLEKRRAKISAEVLTEQAIIMTISLQNIETFLKKSPDIVKNFLNHALRQMEKYQVLWMQD